ncbi:flavin-dependent dehydrogenase [Flavobacterium arsenatis]|uniref:Flavin-dependent dehydrogenase n=1 Tax=Flavobacterium arsenatis TaxID=1484332 RepID=A0ABU1TPK1_9FLAO|nr:NAD(P)/FAD-dependent oxidoreductase [Flavobacterium arsenatis]MDR6967373.1 flavin-dependent dehydrogenase [Flavobacterium arsenatis]
MKNNGVIIIGGGLAGLTAAIHLSKIGIEVTLVEKNDFPKHKVCGEYISNEVLPYLSWLDIDIPLLKPQSISNFLFSTESGKTISGNLPLGGFGISRYEFDYLLYKKALENKCKIIKDIVTDINFSNDEFDVNLSEGKVLKANIVIGAFGKRSTIDQKLNRDFILKKSPWLAVKGHFNGDFPSDLVGLYNFKGGYCGVSNVENNILNICYLADYATFKKYKNTDHYEKAVLYKNPLLKSIFENATPIFDKPLTISQISFSEKNCVENHILMIGDTAGLIHPLCGNGMAMAIHGAKIVSELIPEYFSGAITRETFEKNYIKQWTKNFSSRLKTGRLLSRLLQNKNLSEGIMDIFGVFPYLLPKIIQKTHGKTLTI